MALTGPIYEQWSRDLGEWALATERRMREIQADDKMEEACFEWAGMWQELMAVVTELIVRRSRLPCSESEKDVIISLEWPEKKELVLRKVIPMVHEREN
ncbi:hypothetical protein NDU88_001596 [Pleurodeles waltl]|uniref:Uncharacterized protein n=1 Tax=Pleurodeles waltl TaxID=8319 RepID=A0AAV7V892_PLEWA|nr:hypothetical protein NDU88_001596 [Pleurodeles waltl]